MAASFDINVTDTAAAYEKAKSAIQSHGGKIDGDADGGTFEGKTPLGAVKGRYKAAGNTIAVTIESKPMLVPQSKVESAVKEFFGSA